MNQCEWGVEYQFSVCLTVVLKAGSNDRMRNKPTGKKDLAPSMRRGHAVWWNQQDAWGETQGGGGDASPISSQICVSGYIILFSLT